MKKLKSIRKKTKYTQLDLANYLNIPKTTYANYEQIEKCLPPIDILFKLADFFKVTIDELLGHEIQFLINKSNFSDVQLEIINEIQNLNNEQCYNVLAFISGINNELQRQNKIIEKYKNNKN